MRLHKEAFGAIVQIKVESITEKFENIGAVVSSKLIELQKSLSPALVEEILKLEAFKDIKQPIVSIILTKVFKVCVKNANCCICTLREKCPNTEFFLVCIFLCSD